jgi:hypothetical protein
MTEMMEIQAENPTFHVLFIPGNPGFIIMLKTLMHARVYTSVLHTLACNFSGVVSFYKDFLESLYEFLGGNASVIAIGQISHTSKDWESGRLFSFQEQIDHKIDFIRQELESVKVPIILVRLSCV